MPAPTADAASAPAPRSDAARNRRRLLTASAALLAERGTDLDVREIARNAGVGMGTLYRHFPTKEQLLETALETAFAQWAADARAAFTDDPWHDLAAFLDDALHRQHRHRGLHDGYATPPWREATPPADAATSSATDPLTTHCRTHLHPVIDELVARARQSGTLRADVDTSDVALLLLSLGALTPLGPAAWQRPLQLVLDGLADRPASGSS